jgi:TetR/AcrR family transcriptional regulator
MNITLNTERQSMCCQSVTVAGRWHGHGGRCVANVVVVVGSSKVVDLGKGAPRRRSPDPRRRQDPERTRRALLAAAAVEFGEHGYEGARVARIAEAAGMGHQLITYHFGGKRGLYDALNEQWLARNDALIATEQPLSAVIGDYVRWVRADEAWTRTLVRESLDGDFPVDDARVARLGKLLDQARERQARGELREDIDVGALSLSLLAACIAPTILPGLARAFVGMDTASDEFWDRYAEHLMMVMGALSDPQAEASRTSGR